MGLSPSVSTAASVATLAPTKEPDSTITTGIPRGRSSDAITRTSAAARSGFVAVRLEARSPSVVVIGVYSWPTMPVRLGSASGGGMRPRADFCASSTSLAACMVRAAISISA
jgi:hypothetical protein